MTRVEDMERLICLSCEDLGGLEGLPSSGASQLLKVVGSKH